MTAQDAVAEPATRARGSGVLSLLTGLLDRYGLASGYAVALAAGSLALQKQPTTTQQSWTAWASTSLDNLAVHPIGSLVTSGLLSTDDLGWWVLFALVGLGMLGRRVGWWRAGLVAGAGHVVGTALSQGLLAWRIDHGDADAGLRTMVDVGPSYLVVAALIAAGVVERRWWRLLPLACFGLLAPSLFEGLTALDVTPVGHAVAVTTGLAGGLLCLRRRR